jgi:hypothetical protein
MPQDRDTLCWRGGGILSNLTYFKTMWITKKVNLFTPKIIFKYMNISIKGIPRRGHENFAKKIYMIKY